MLSQEDGEAKIKGIINGVQINMDELFKANQIICKTFSIDPNTFLPRAGHLSKDAVKKIDKLKAECDAKVARFRHEAFKRQSEYERIRTELYKIDPNKAIGFKHYDYENL